MGNEASQSQSFGDKIDNDILIRWKKVETSFPEREGQICCTSGNKVFAFGGVSQVDDELCESNDLLVFDPASDKKQWTKLVVKGCLPPPRTAAAITSVGHKIYLFGGFSQSIGWFNDLYCFDTDNNTWSVVSADGPKPLPRDKLQCVAIDKKIYYFGGFGPKTADAELESEDDSEDELPDGGAEFGWFNDLYVLDTEKNQWSQPMQMNLGLPEARAAHSMCAVGRDIVIFGGRGNKARLNDLHIFNIDTRKWATELEVKGRQPEARSFHTSVSVGKRAVIMGGRGTANQHFADVNIFDTETKEWLQPTSEGDLPLPRGQHSLAVAGSQVVLFGGSGKYNDDTMQCHEHYTDTYVISLDDFNKGGSKTKPNAAGDATNGHSS